ncbi:hypothetical protein CRM22_003260 [Opisthorchis felineus]|uniref:Phospholipid-transporting ATPase n=1 Tax=Opisthorchis felineus TaxID=147828 RepID=A0A4S2M8B3_OPIFE|nr:hypothetical protein CRM22_003260 [Opisthorchis felineus]TGZ70328.1 hypothetical protein CRM22_003260 [Opisthorchis felineus]
MRECIQKAGIRLGLRRPPLPPQRDIPVGPISKLTFVSPDYSLKKLYGDNEITTSRYTWYGFIFQNLVEQAQRIANFYFICIAVVQIFTDSPVTPAISIIPLVFVLAVTLVKQGYEDWLRHRADREVNHVRVEVVTEDGRLQTVKAMELTVGDIVLCRVNDIFPCDMLILSSSEQNGECYVTTASLDGETNLKRFVAPELTRMYDSPDLLAKNLRGKITCQQPIDDLYAFNGRLTVENEVGGAEVCPIGPSNLLLRGACLRNTDFVYACAVYTGQDTKMALNSKGKKTKFSQVERRLNYYLAIILAFLVTCSLISSILMFALPLKNAWYIQPQMISAWTVVQTFLGFIVLYNYIIPISLYVTIEVQKFFGSLFFEWDINLYDKNLNERAKCNTSDLLEEMGQVEYLFTDKTGTLTENLMQFRRFATALGTFGVKGGKIYKILSDQRRRSTLVGELETLFGDVVDLTPSTSLSEEPTDADLLSSIQTLLLVLSLCHTVRVEKQLPGEEPTTGKHKKKKRGAAPSSSVAATTAVIDTLQQFREPPRRGSSALRRASAAQSASAAVRASRRGKKVKAEDYIYQASSPDEKAFVEATRDLGVVYHGVDESGIHVVTEHGLALRYRLLDILEFDATRKCMSVVLQPFTPGSQLDEEAPVVVLCKGAETAMLPRVATDQQVITVPHQSTDPLVRGLSGRLRSEISMTTEETMSQVTEFASSGLRTLVMGAKLISAAQWYEMKQELDTARGLLENRDAALAAAYAKIESNLTLVGCTGIEDMLQNGVPETITALREAGIQVWVLTGDKEETAVNISYSAGHFFVGMSEVRITRHTSLRSCLDALNTQWERMKEAKRLLASQQFGIVIDGQSLNFALEIELRDKFVECCQCASTVLCCRLTPLQKAEVVRLIKESRSPAPVTAAIGDGANDVSMILEAHVSFGLYGKEGRQAVRAADYAFGRFKFLKSALLFHGHTYYKRVALLVLYFFYKNLLFTLPQMLFGFFCSYSAQTIYPEVYMVFYNITMTSLPIFLFGLFEKPVPEHILLAYPRLYRDIVRNRSLSLINFIVWITLAVWHGFVIFFGVYFLAFRGQASGGSDPVSGYGGSAVGAILGFGNLLIMTIFIVTNLRVYLFSYYLNWIVLLGNVLAFLLNLSMYTFLNFYLFPLETPAELFATWSVLWGGSGLGTPWLAFPVLICLSLLPDLALRALTDQGWKWRVAEMQEEQEHMETEPKSVVRNGTSAAHNVCRTDVGNSLMEQTPSQPSFREPVYYVNPSFEWTRTDPLKGIEPSTVYRDAPPRSIPVQELFERGPIQPIPTKGVSNSRTQS